MKRQLKNSGNLLFNPPGRPSTQNILDRGRGERVRFLERFQRAKLLSQSPLDVFSVQRLAHWFSRATGESRSEDKTSPMGDCQ